MAAARKTRPKQKAPAPGKDLLHAAAIGKLDPDSATTKSFKRIVSEALAMHEHLVEVYGEDFTVGCVVMVVDLIVDVGDGVTLNPIEICSSDPRRWVTNAIVHEALETAEAHNYQRRLDAEGDEDGDELEEVE
jgi:hypothetical protein